MLYGLTGSHRSGKSTLGEKVGEFLSINFEPIKTTEVAKRFGFDPVQPMTLLQRCELQMILFEDYIQLIEKLPRPLIVDRTPLDHIGYLLAEMTMRSGDYLSDAMLAKVEAFITLALDSVVKYFDFVFYLDPLSGYAVDPTKPPPNRVYQQHHALVLRGLIAALNERINWAIIPEMPIEQRTEIVSTIIAKRMDVIDNMKKKAVFMN